MFVLLSIFKITLQHKKNVKISLIKLLFSEMGCNVLKATVNYFFQSVSTTERLKITSHHKNDIKFSRRLHFAK